MAKTKPRKGKRAAAGRKRAGGESALLTLCVIARDEATFLDRCLASVEGLADDIVVVDTGSRDDTIDLARHRGGRVFEFPWNEDFSSARNHGLARARGRWILTFDCDEVVARRDHGALRAAMKAGSQVAGYRITTRNYTHQADRAGWVASDGSYPEEEKGYGGWHPTTKVRLWRNRQAYRFQGVVHELVEGSILEAGGRIADCDVPVHHYGLVEKERPANRYVEAGERKADDDPDDLRAAYELAVAYRDAGRLDEALDRIVAVVEGIRRGGSQRQLYLEEENVLLVHGDVLDRMGRLEDALTVYRSIPERFVSCHQAHNNAGSLLGRLGRLDEAREAYRCALELAPDNAVIADNLDRLERRTAAVDPAAGKLPEAGDTTSHTLSVCVIVRDGGDDLDRCLSSVKAAADEIVVVDTGSSDDSVAVAEGHGARIGHFDWCDDFSAARNASLDMATGDWILWLDADDYLTDRDLGCVQRAKRMTPDVALSFTLVNTGVSHRTGFRQIKMFPNRPGIRFVRPVHETVLPALEREGVSVRIADACVMHTGYAEPQAVARKTAYYRRLMKTWLDEHPEDLDICFRLGHTAYDAGDRDRAQLFFDRVLQAGPDLKPQSLRCHAAVFRGRCRLEGGTGRRRSRTSSWPSICPGTTCWPTSLSATL